MRRRASRPWRARGLARVPRVPLARRRRVVARRRDGALAPSAPRRRRARARRRNAAERDGRAPGGPRVAARGGRRRRAPRDAAAAFRRRIASRSCAPRGRSRRDVADGARVEPRRADARRRRDRARVDRGRRCSSPPTRATSSREGTRTAELAARASGRALGQRIATLLAGFGDDAPQRRARPRPRGAARATLRGARAARVRGRSSVVDRVLDRALLCGPPPRRWARRVSLRASTLPRRDRRAAASAATTRRRSSAPRRTRSWRSTGLRTPTARWRSRCCIARAATATPQRSHRSRRSVRSRGRRARTSTRPSRARAVGELDRSRRPAGDSPAPTRSLERARGLRYYFGLDYPRAREHHLEQALEIVPRARRRRATSTMSLFDISLDVLLRGSFRRGGALRRSSSTSPAWSPLALARVEHRLAEITAIRGDLSGALQHQRLACEAAKNDARSALLRELVTQTLADLLIATNQFDGAAQTLSAALALADEIDDRHVRSQYFEHTTRRPRRDGRPTSRGARPTRALPRRTRGARRLLALDERARAGGLCYSRSWRTPSASLRARCGVRRRVPARPPRRASHVVVRASGARRAARAWREDLADRAIGAVIDARVETIARAFDEAEPITEDEAARSNAARAASSR